MVRKRFALGPFLLDTGREVLYEHGVPVAIGRKAYALLRALVEARGDVVTKAALMEVAWPNVSVEESNLTVQIAALRRRLRASNGGEDPIETFSRIGYRLAAPLRIEECEASPAHSPDDTPQPALSSTHRQIRLEAYDLYVRGRSLVMHSPGGNRLARSYLIKAIGLEPEFAPAHAFLAISYNGEAVHYGVEVDANRAIGLASARTAVSVDPNDPAAHWALGYVRFYGGEPHEAQRDFEAALRIDPDQADALVKMADLKVQDGQPDEAIAMAEKGCRLNPCPPGWYYWNLGFAYYATGRYAEAADVLSKVEVGLLPAKRILAASLAQLGQLDRARLEARRFLEINPGFQASAWAAAQAFKDKADQEHFVEGYIKAGLPR